MGSQFRDGADAGDDSVVLCTSLGVKRLDVRVLFQLVQSVHGVLFLNYALGSTDLRIFFCF